MESKGVDRVAIIGAGMMGRRVAWACLAHGQTVHLMSRKTETLDQARKDIARWLESRTPAADNVNDALRRLTISTNLDLAIQSVDLIYENVDENVELKSRIHQELGRKAVGDILIGSNTASIPCEILAQASGRPERFFNMNCDEPLELSFVEIMGALPVENRMMSQTLDRAEMWARSIGQVPIRLNSDSQGYAFNRTWRAIKREFLHLADQGVCSHEDLDRMFMMSFQTNAGPFGMMDHVGLANILNVEQQYYDFSQDEKDKPPQMLKDLVSAGHLGVTTGQGFYHYPNPAYKEPGWVRQNRGMTDD
ncbi:MAG: 3-hydroxyacyl-CoA dehydrogenase family protein [Pseudomonadota bacterium]